MCFYEIAKYLLFFFNFIFWCMGAAVLGIGIWLLVDASALADFTDVIGVDIYQAGPIIFIIAGAVMLVFGFFGCCGAIKESTCLLGTYFTMLFIIFGLEVGIGIWGFVTYDSVDEVIYDGTTTLFSNSGYDQTAAESMQERFECCGTKQNATDPDYGCEVYNTLTASGATINSCVCTSDDATKCGTAPTACPTATGDIWLQECGAELTTFTEDNIQIIGIVGIVIGCVEILGMMISMCLCCKIKDKGEI